MIFERNTASIRNIYWTLDSWSYQRRRSKTPDWAAGRGFNLRIAFWMMARSPKNGPSRRLNFRNTIFEAAYKTLLRLHGVARE